MILNTLGGFYNTTQRFADAVNYYEQSLDVYRGLSKSGQTKYLREQAWVLNNLAGLGVNHHFSLRRARAYNDEALKIQRGLWDGNPAMYGDDLAATLLTRAQLLGPPGSHKKQGCAFVSEAQRLASSDVIKAGAQVLASRCK